MIKMILSNANLFVFVDNLYKNPWSDRKISFQMYINLFIQSKI